MKHPFPILLCFLGIFLTFKPSTQRVVPGQLYSPKVPKIGEQFQITCGAPQLFGNISYNAQRQMREIDIWKVVEEFNNRHAYSAVYEFRCEFPRIFPERNRWYPQVKATPYSGRTLDEYGLKIEMKMTCRHFGNYVCAVQVRNRNPPPRIIYYYKDFYVDYIDNVPTLAVERKSGLGTVNLLCEQSTHEKDVNFYFVWRKPDDDQYYSLTEKELTQRVVRKGTPCGGYITETVRVTFEYALNQDAWFGKVFCMARRPAVEAPHEYTSQYLREDLASNYVEIANCILHNRSCGVNPTQHAAPISGGPGGIEDDVDQRRKGEGAQIPHDQIWAILLSSIFVMQLSVS